jgi:hypothetical protein
MPSQKVSKKREKPTDKSKAANPTVQRLMTQQEAVKRLTLTNTLALLDSLAGFS